MLKFKYCAVDLGGRGREGGGHLKKGKQIQIVKLYSRWACSPAKLRHDKLDAELVSLPSFMPARFCDRRNPTPC